MTSPLAGPASLPLSVILVSPSGSAAIRLTALHLAEQTARDRMEVVIVAPRAGDVSEAVADLGACRSVRVVPLERVTSRGHAAAHGARAASGRIIAMIENHAVPDPDWAEALLRAHEGPWAGVGPGVTFMNPRSWVARADALINYSALMGFDRATEVDRLPWQNSAYKREALAAYDAELDEMLDPEARLHHRLRAEGGRLVIDPSARVRHIFTSSLAVAILGRIQLGRAFAAGRSAAWAWPRRLVYATLWPLFPAMMVMHLHGNVARVRRFIPIHSSLPGVLFLLTMSALGESIGYMFGPGHSKAWRERHELELGLRVNRGEFREMEALVAERLAKRGAAGGAPAATGAAATAGAATVEPPAEGAAADAPLLSVIIPTFARRHLIGGCLGALRAQRTQRGRFEVIVVDDGGPEPLDDVVAPFRADLDLTLLRQANGGPGAARNAGASVARGRWLAFTDDDCRPDPGWVDGLLARFERDPDRILGGRTVNALADNAEAETSQIILEMVYAFYDEDPDDARFFASNNLAVPAAAFRQIGGFDERSFRVGSEDRELCDRWRHSGRGMAYAPEALIRHAHDLSFGEFVRQHWGYGRGAFHFHEARRRRGSGRMRQEMGFHARLPSLARAPLSRLAPFMRARVLALLAVWQVANAAGFLREMIRARRSPGF
jgi:GT2 family glycosyltransferase